MLATYLAACIVSFIVGSVFLHRSLPLAALDVPANYETKRWLRSSVPLMLLSSVTVLDSQVGVIALTITGNPSDVGHFAVASRLAEFLGFVTLAVNAGAGPTLAQLSAKGEFAELRRVAGQCAGLMVSATVLLGAGLVLSSGPLLQLFGGDFSDSEEALRVLVIGQILNSAMGPVALLLIMTGSERAATAGVLVGTCLNFALTLALADAFGVAGAALGRSASLVVWGALLTLVAVRRLGFGAGLWEFRVNRDSPPGDPS
jgi:O-antigen/teichoic acid export membrane protein